MADATTTQSIPLSVVVTPDATSSVVIQSIPTAAAPIIKPIVNMLTFSGWDGSKVVTTNTDTITVTNSDGTPAANVPIQIYELTYGHLVVTNQTDANGQYLFNIIRDAGSGNMNFRVEVPSLGIKQNVNMIVTSVDN